MKKEMLIITLLAFSLISAIYLSHVSLAATADDIIKTGTGVDINKVPTNPDDAKQASKDFLKKEWIKFLGNTSTNNTYVISPMIRFYNNNPFIGSTFEYTIGVRPSLTWLFLLSLTLWIVFIIYFHRIISAFSTFSYWVSIVASILIAVILANIGFIKGLSTKIINALGMLTSWWMQLIGVILIWVLIVFASFYSKQFEAIMKKWKENRKKMKEEMRLREIEFKQKLEETANKPVREALGKAFSNNN
jgi:hypothetical protein